MAKRTNSAARKGLTRLIRKIDATRKSNGIGPIGNQELSGGSQEPESVDGIDPGHPDSIDPALLSEPDPIERGPEPEPVGGEPELEGLEFERPQQHTEPSGGTTTEPKRRGRPPGFGNGPNASKAASNLIPELQALLYSVHLMGAAFLKVPELEIDDNEAERLAGAIKRVAKYYSVSIDPKKMAMFELSTVALTIYGPRVVAIVKNASKNKVDKPEIAAPQTVQSKPAASEKGPQLVKRETPTPPTMEITTPSQINGEPPLDFMVL